MSTFTIPNSQGQINVTHNGDYGELTETFNVDLVTSPGKIKVSKKLTPILLEGTHIGTPAGIQDLLIWDSKYILCTEDGVYTCSTSSDPTNPSNWSATASLDDLDQNSTAIVFDDGTNIRLRISLDTNIAKSNANNSYADDWWTSDIGGTALQSGYPHVLEKVQSQKETLFVTDKDKVHYVEKSGLPKTVQLDSNVVASCLAPGLSGAMWVGTYNETDGQAYVYEIYVGEVVDSTPVYSQAYPIGARAVLAIWMVNNTPHIITERGDIQQFNGAGFSYVTEFPFKWTSKTLDGVQPGRIQDTDRSRPIHPRGVKVYGDSVFININMDSAEDVYTVSPRAHSGIWEFNYKTQQLNHRFAFANSTNQYSSSKGHFAYPILVVDNEYTFIMAGGYDPTGNDDNVYMTTDGTPQGYFVTGEIMSQTVTDVYSNVYQKAKTLASGEEIILQYRTSKRDTVYGTANWTSTTKFVTTDDWSTVAVGDLVRVSHGYAAGDYANVVSIETSSTTYTITVDRAIGANTETSYVFSDNFKKDPTTYTSEDGEYKQYGDYGTNPWIQFMVIMKGNIEYRQFISKGNSKHEK